MPRKVNPGDILVGKGLAPEGTVEDNSLRYPERDADPLRVHVHDPSRAHMASAIGIVDAADCYVSDEVEGALQELCGHTGAGRLNGLVSGGTFVELTTANGTGPIALAGISSTLTLVTPTEVLMNGTVFEASALTVVLPAAADTYYIYLETQATHPSYRTLVAGTSPPPEVETAGGVENVMFAKVTHDGTNITSWQDARFFVRNLDRKVTYSSRKGENVDAWSEGCFATLEAFFFWAENYGDTGTSEEEKGTVLIRGAHAITQSLVVPTDHLQFVGDGEAILLVGNAPLDIFTLSGKSDISFHGINFASQIAGSRGIVATGLCNDIVVDSCTFGKVAGVGFLGAVSIGGGAGSNRIRMSGCDALLAGANCFGLAADGGPGQGTATVENCLFSGPGAGTPGVGIDLTPTSGGKGASVLNTTIDGFYTGVQCGQMQEFRLTNTVIRDAQTGFLTTGKVEHLYVSGCSVYLDDSNGKYGFSIHDNSNHINISDTYLYQPVTNMTDTRGIWIEAPAGEAAVVVIEGCQIEGFYDSTGNTGQGIYLEGSSTNGFLNATLANCTFKGSPITAYWAKALAITGNTMAAGGNTDLIHLKSCDGVAVTANILAGFGDAEKGICLDGTTNGQPCQEVMIGQNKISGCTTYSIHLEGEVDTVTITGNVLDGFSSGAPTSVGILTDGGDNGVPHNVVIDGNQISRSMGGIWIRGYNQNLSSTGFTVSNNAIREIAFDQQSRVETFEGYGTKGLACEFADDISFLGNKVSQMGVVLDNTGTPIVWPQNVWTLGVYVRNSHNVVVDGNTISNSQSSGVDGTCLGIVAHVNGVTNTFDMALVAITNNTVAVAEGGSANEVGVGVYLTDPNHTQLFTESIIKGNQVLAHKGNPITDGILLTTLDLSGVSYGGSCDSLDISDNNVQNFIRKGIAVQLPAQATQNQPNSFAFGRITDNYIFSIGSGEAACAGIEVSVESNVQSAILQQLDLRGNQIPYWVGSAIRIEILNAGATTTFQKCLIEGNTMGAGAADPSALHTAIIVQRTGTGYNSAAALDLEISRNKVGAGAIGQAPQKAILVNLGTDTQATALRNLRLVGNTTYSYADDPLDPGVRVYYEGAGATPTSLYGYVIENNQFTNLDAATATTALSVVLKNAALDASSISYNQLNAPGKATANGVGCNLLLGNTTGTFADSTLVKVQGNEVIGQLWVVLSAQKVKDLSLTDNRITMPALAGTALPEGHACIEIAVDGGNVSSTGLIALIVANNVTSGGNHGIRVDTQRLDDGVEGVRVTDNTMRGQKAPNVATPHLGHGLWVAFSTIPDPLQKLSGVVIDGNQSVQEVGWDGIHILADFSHIQHVQNVSVSRNQLTGPHYLTDSNATYFQQASLVVARAMGTDSPSTSRNWKIDDNEIGGDGFDHWANSPQNGIYFYGPTDCSAFHEIDNISLSGNQIRVQTESLTLGDKGRGMWVEFNDERDLPYRVAGLKIDNNQIFGDSPSRAEELDGWLDGLILELTCAVRGLSVSGNSITNESMRMNRYGLRIYQDFEIGQCERDEKNIIVNYPSAYIYIAGTKVTGPVNYDFEGWPNDTGAPGGADKFNAVTWEDLTISDNTVQWGAGKPEGYIFADTAKLPEYGAFVFQHIRTMYNNTEQGSFGSWVPTDPIPMPDNMYFYRPICVPVWGCTITGNTIRAARSNSPVVVVGVPAGNTQDAFYGVRINAVSPYIRWPNSGQASYQSQLSEMLQDGWTIVGNSAVFFMVKTEGDPSTYIGKCVTSIIGHTTASSGWPGNGLYYQPLAMNTATDNDGTHMGWGEVGNNNFVGADPAQAKLHPSDPGSRDPTARNHNGNPRTQ